MRATMCHPERAAKRRSRRANIRSHLKTPIVSGFSSFAEPAGEPDYIGLLLEILGTGDRAAREEGTAMKSRYGLCLASVLAGLVGCSSTTPPVFAPFGAQTTGAQMNGDTDAKKKPFETLTTKKTAVKTLSCVSGSGSAQFTAKGKAKGRYRGKFSVSGGWNFVNVSGVSFWTFAETFLIKGKHPITGTMEGTGSEAFATCKTFGPVKGSVDLTFHLGTKTGSPTLKVIKDGAPLFQLMR